MISVMRIRALYNRARLADRERADAALAELRSVNEELRTRANRQYTGLRRSVYAYGNAYDYATGYIQANYGSNARSFYKQKSLVDVYEQTLVLQRLLNDTSFSIAGQQAQEVKRFKAFQEGGLDLVKELGSVKLARQFLRFLGNSGAGDYLDVFAAKNSWQAMEQLFEIFAESDDYREKLMDVFSEFQLYLDTMEDEQWYGMTYTQVRDYVEQTYEDIKKRRR